MKKELNQLLRTWYKRSENNEDNYNIIKSFVNIGSLYSYLSHDESQIIMGRRGTGKTHAFKYLHANLKNESKISVYIDLRKIGSNNSIYGDFNLPLTERASRLLRDTMNYVFSSISLQIEDLIVNGKLELVNNNFDEYINVMDSVDSEINEVSVYEIDTTQEITQQKNFLNKQTKKRGLNIDLENISYSRNKIIDIEDKKHEQIFESSKTIKYHRVHFQSLNHKLEHLLSFLNSHKIWLLFDEWGEIPYDLQPFLADLFKHIFLPNPKIVFKIASIEQRAFFYYPLENGKYIGFDLGNDIGADINLDEYNLFENNKELALSFFKKFLFKHIESEKSFVLKALKISNENELINEIFSDNFAFEHFVLASEGNPRDAISIISNASFRAGEKKISVEHVKNAAKHCFTKYKKSQIKENGAAQTLLREIIKTVLVEKRSRGFLVSSELRIEILDILFYEKLIHKLKDDITDYEKPYNSYILYSIDYGCYLDLLDTSKAPRGLFKIVTDEGYQRYVDKIESKFKNFYDSILDEDYFRNVFEKKST